MLNVLSLALLSAAAFEAGCAQQETPSSRTLTSAAIPARPTEIPSTFPLSERTVHDVSAIDGLLKALPDRAGAFIAGPVMTDPAFARRTYTRGKTRINVTISKPGAAPGTFEDWVNMSADAPQVSLDVPPNAGAGFYDCVGKQLEGLCNVHIQLRSGHHIEMMNEHDARRADFDALLKDLPFKGLTH